MFKLFGSFFKKSNNAHTSTPNRIITQEDITASSIRESLRIPEPTLSLLWITDEDPSKIEVAGSINISITLTKDGPQLKESENGFYAEPSLIWTKLPIKLNSDLYKDPMYYPAYSKFYPETRYQYLNWLRDITQETNLSYVFLYFYGLERHLLVGDYDKAVDEIIRLLKYHSKASFRSYAIRSLIIASIARKRVDIIKRAPFILEEEIDEALALRILEGTTLSAEDMINIASAVGFKNKRYIKLHPDLFKSKLQELIDDFEAKYGKIMTVFNLKDFKYRPISVFANLSLPDTIRNVKVPLILENTEFKNGIREMLTTAHQRVKEELNRQRAH